VLLVQQVQQDLQVQQVQQVQLVQQAHKEQQELDILEPNSDQTISMFKNYLQTVLPQKLI
jgi:hypothetical protein